VLAVHGVVSAGLLAAGFVRVAGLVMLVGNIVAFTVDWHSRKDW
jgi:hypothetical protein